MCRDRPRPSPPSPHGLRLADVEHVKVRRIRPACLRPQLFHGGARCPPARDQARRRPEFATSRAIANPIPVPRGDDAYTSVECFVWEQTTSLHANLNRALEVRKSRSYVMRGRRCSCRPGDEAVGEFGLRPA